MGAPPSDVFWSTARRALALTGAGVAVGLTGCVAARGVLQKVIYNLGSSEPAVLAGVSVVMLTIAFTACWVPARRAMRVDAAEVLRGE